MDPQLLVRVYNVGLGDCIYICAPDKNRDVHILIDCGNKFEDLTRLGSAVENMKTLLPDDGSGKKHLDLLVVSHPHEDHHKGFEEAFFQDIKIDRLWLSPAYNPQQPKAEGFRSLQEAARRALLGFSQLAVGEVKEQVDDLLLSLSKPEALEMLRHTLPAANGIQPLYVTTSTPAGDLKIFEDPAIQIKVLNPVADIDAIYLGAEGLINPPAGLDSQGLVDGYQALFPGEASVEPENISWLDFQLLRSRMQGSALSLADIAGEAANNISLVLLLEWRSYRLLFTGDAEWKSGGDGAVIPGRCNGAWNVMWQENKAELSQPLDFLKVGHHGSVNATPWTPPDAATGKVHPINQILDHLLPSIPGNQPPKARAAVSTLRTERWPSIPDAVLMEEIGKRVKNIRPEYVEKPGPKSVQPHVPQPQRTDLEMQVTPTPETPVPYIDFYFPETIDE